MAMDPGMMQQMLAKQLSQPASGGAQGGQQGQISSMNAAATLAQKAMLVHALNSQPNAPATPFAQWQANSQMPNSQAQMQQDPSMQAMQQSPASMLSPDQLQQLQMPVNPSMMPPSGVS